MLSCLTLSPQSPLLHPPLLVLPLLSRTTYPLYACRSPISWKERERTLVSTEELREEDGRVIWSITTVQVTVCRSPPSTALGLGPRLSVVVDGSSVVRGSVGDRLGAEVEWGGLETQVGKRQNSTPERRVREGARTRGGAQVLDTGERIVVCVYSYEPTHVHPVRGDDGTVPVSENVGPGRAF